MILIIEIKGGILIIEFLLFGKMRKVRLITDNSRHSQVQVP